MDNDTEEELNSTSRRVTGGESLRQLRRALSSKRSINGGAYGGRPPKRQFPETVSSRAYTQVVMSEKHSEYIRRHFDSEADNREENIEERTHNTESVHHEEEAAHRTQQRKKLFAEENKEQDLFHTALDRIYFIQRAIEQAHEQDDDITELTDGMDRQQLETGFKHIIQRMRNLQESQQKGKPSKPCKSSSSDSQLLRSPAEKRSSEPNTPDRANKK